MAISCTVSTAHHSEQVVSPVRLHRDDLKRRARRLSHVLIRALEEPDERRHAAGASALRQRVRMLEEKVEAAEGASQRVDTALRSRVSELRELAEGGEVNSRYWQDTKYNSLDAKHTIAGADFRVRAVKKSIPKSINKSLKNGSQKKKSNKLWKITEKVIENRSKNK